jgi:hypothetical protein
MQRHTDSRAVVVRFLLASCLVVVVSTRGVGGAEEPSSPIVEVESPPAGCQNLGEVEGESSGFALRPEAAKKFAFDDARKLGATHVQPVPAKTGQQSSYKYIYTGIAFRCPGSPGGAPAK